MSVYWCPFQSYPHRYLSVLAFLNENMKTSFPYCEFDVLYSLISCAVIATVAACAFPINLWWFNDAVYPNFISFLFALVMLAIQLNYLLFSIQLPVVTHSLQYVCIYCTAFPTLQSQKSKHIVKVCVSVYKRHKNSIVFALNPFNTVSLSK